MDTAIIPERPNHQRVEKKKSSSNRDEEHSWDYVYSDLSSKGYSKDLGSRPDILADSKKHESRKEPKAPPPPKEPEPPKENALEWKCNACTFLNPVDSNICSICYKSKDVAHENHIPHGPECPQCTFKNFVGRDYCDACGALLRPPVPVEDIV
jgi:hypothetical protein